MERGFKGLSHSLFYRRRCAYANDVVRIRTNGLEISLNMIWGSTALLPYIILAMLPALTFHEWGHAAMAKAYGDDTAQRAGRLTLNPMAHLDIMGTIFILLVGFGWAKPVPVNPANFRSKWAEFWVALAGPLMNIALALCFVVLIGTGLLNFLPSDQAQILAKLLMISIYMNFALALFNLIPIGPLDGEKVLARLLPLRTSFAFENWNARYGATVLFGIIILESLLRIGILRFVVHGPAQWLTSFFTQLF